MKHWTVQDVMTVKVTTATPETPYKQIAQTLIAGAISALPVVDERRHVIGMVSEADLLAKLQYADQMPRHILVSRRVRTGQDRAHGDTAAQLMTTPAVTIHAAASVTKAARLMDTAGLRRLPVVDQDDQLVGIVARRDLLRLYNRTDEQLQATLVDDLRAALWIDPEDVQVSVDAGVVTLHGTVDRRTTAAIVANFVRATPGVVDVHNRLAFDLDDGDIVGSRRFSRSVLRP